MTRANRRRLGYVFSAWLFVGMLSGAETYAFRLLSGRTASLGVCLLARVPPWLTWALVTAPLLAVTTRPRLRLRPLLPSLLPHLARFLLASLGFAVVYALGDVGFGLAPDLAGQRLAFAPRLMQALLGWSMALLLAYVGTVVVAVTLAALSEQRRAEQAQATLAAQLAEARLSALTAQLQPHFLFNALNTVLSFVRGEALRDAERALLLLADILRDVLGARDQAELPLGDELKLLERYLELQQLRFSDRLRVTWDVDPRALGVKVPTLLLQPVVENAIRHGISARRDAGRLRIAARLEAGLLMLDVEDDGPGLPRDGEVGRRGVGLRNTRARLEQRHGAAGVLALGRGRDGGAHVSIRLPAT
jgi:two-component sensor histidine kinase